MTTTNTATVNVPEGLYPIDVTAPVIAIVSPNAFTSIGRTIAISVQATDDSNQTPLLKVYLDGNLLGTGTGSFSQGVTISKGQHNLYVESIDPSGNVGTKTYTFSR